MIISLTLSSHASILQVSGDVSGTWDADTIQVMDHILVPNNQSLLINPGVKVIFDGYYTFRIEGQIQANGLENDSISFYVSDTTGLYNLDNNLGSWAGFWFDHMLPNNDSSLFNYCQFKYGKAVSEDSIYWYGGAVYVHKFNRLRFSNCSFSNNIAYKNGGAIYCRSSNIKIEHCEFMDNAGGTPIDFGYGGAICLEYSDAKIFRNYFSRNSSTGVGGGLSFEYSNPDIKANIFYQNYSAIGGGLCCLRSEIGYPIANNLFNQNASTFFGGAVAFLEAHSLFINNTIINNASMYGGGFQINLGSLPIIKNCIIWNNSNSSENGAQVYVYDVNSAPAFSYNNILGGFADFGGTGVGNCIYEDNMDLNPQFVGAGEFPFSLAENSPCVNSGTPDTLGLFLPEKDLAGNTRFEEFRIDMGCYENQGIIGVQVLSTNDFEFYILPNPITEYSIIQLNVQGRRFLEFTLIDDQGKEVTNIPMQDYEQGKHEIPLAIHHLNSGLYLLKGLEKSTKQTQVLKIIMP